MKYFIKFVLASFVILVALFSLWYILGDFKFKKNDSPFVLAALEHRKNIKSNAVEVDITEFVIDNVKITNVNEFAEFLERNQINYNVRYDNNKIWIGGRYHYYRKSDIFGSHILAVAATFDGDKLLILRGSIYFDSI